MKARDTSNGGDFQRPDPGTYLARCVRLIDLGTQAGEWQGKPTSKHQIILAWELPEELIPEGEYEGQPFLVSKFYNLTLNEKATLRHDLVNWRGRDFTDEELDGFEMKNILGKGCMITLTNKENGYPKVTAVTALPKGMKVTEQVNPTVDFSLDAGEYDPEVYEALSDGIKGIIAKSPEWQWADKMARGITPEAAVQNDDEFTVDDADGIPF